VLYYLRGLLNGRLAEMPLEEALRAPLRLSECGVSGALVDLVKLNDISANYVATMPSKDILDAVLTWADAQDPELAQAVRAEQDLAVRALDIERTGVQNPRKDMRAWSEFRPIYGYFFTALFEPVADPADSRFGGLPPDVVRRLCSDLLATYRETEPDAWFDQIRRVAENNGFAASVKDFKNNPDAYVGSIREASQVIRVLLTGCIWSPTRSARPRCDGASGRSSATADTRARRATGPAG
jgi:glutamyl-tRNA synthetase